KRCNSIWTHYRIRSTETTTSRRDWNSLKRTSRLPARGSPEYRVSLRPMTFSVGTRQRTQTSRFRSRFRERMMNTDETRQAIKSAMEGLIASGYEYPLEFVIRRAAGGFFGMRILGDRTVLNEFKSKQQYRVTVPFSIDVFDSNERHHTINVGAVENSMQEE